MPAVSFQVLHAVGSTLHALQPDEAEWGNDLRILSHECDGDERTFDPVPLESMKSIGRRANLYPRTVN
jgi:hypothetical protein